MNYKLFELMVSGKAQRAMRLAAFALAAVGFFGVGELRLDGDFGDFFDTAVPVLN